ncbi:MAG TPA: hypothetical protein VGU63_15210 [Candidatus Acidoferrales bacterium]|nr:hypothetical protein [Candidatus Acidoferrales bacterium]
MERREQVLFDIRRIDIELQKLAVEIGQANDRQERERLDHERDFLVDAKQNLLSETSPS